MNDIISKNYLLKDAKADSQRSLKEYRQRVIMKLRRLNDAYFGHVIKCLFAAGAVGVLSFNGFV